MDDMQKYALGFIVVMGVTYLANKVKSRFKSAEDEDEYELVRQYLLNESPLYGHNKPKLWIHTKYEVNARQWRSFGSRNTTDLNQPYLHLTVKSIIAHCGEDFNVCLIDDASFRKLIPLWDIDVAALPDPLRTQAREMGLVHLLATYGGMLVPNAFLCSKNLLAFYEEGIAGGKPFVGENVAGQLVESGGKRLRFAPDVRFMGAPKEDPCVRDLARHLSERFRFYHVHQESAFLGETAQWCMNAIDRHRMVLKTGEWLGVKNIRREQVALEDLLDDTYLDLDPRCVGIWIPEDDILRRTKYQWFASLSVDEILASNTVLAKYIQASIVDGGTA